MVESLVTVALVLVGVIGISYRAFRDGGWVTQGLGKVADAYVHYPLLALSATIATFFAYRAWTTRRGHGRGGKIYDYVVYVMMGAGIYFIGYYVLTGSL